MRGRDPGARTAPFLRVDRGGTARAVRSAARTIVVLAALGLSDPVAAAEDPTVTMQAEAANARFLAFAPPPAGGAAAVCLVDTGLDLNPDTESSAAARLALDDGDPGDVHPSRHGTRMAMLMGGPVNDWGSVGIWPHIRIVSIRAMPAGETTFPFHYYEQAILACGERAQAQRIVAVNLSLGGVGPTEEQVERLEDVIGFVRSEGISVVAATGNGGGAVEHPAAIPAAVSVGAGSEHDGLCAFSARGPGVDLVAPGCGLDAALADGQPARASGTSDAAAVVSAILTALRSHRPDLSPTQAEAVLARTARSSPEGRHLDAEAAFRAAGLDDVVDAGNARVPRPPESPVPATSHPAAGQPGSAAPPRPRLRSLRRRRGRLVAHVSNRPAGALLSAVVRYSTRRGEFRVRELAFESRRDLITVRVPSAWTRLELRYRVGDDHPSEPLTVRSGRSRRRGAER
jgi:hypothetical protein